MSVSLPNGAIVSMANAYAAAVVISSITNDLPAVVETAAAHGRTEGDYVEVTTGWSRLTDKIVRVGAVADDTHFELEEIDTTDVSVYPVGGSAGSVRAITGRTQLAQILTSNSEGGEQQFLAYQFLEADAQKRIPTFKTASGLKFSIADDPSLPGYILAKAANDDRLPRMVHVLLPSGSEILYNSYISINETPSLTVNELMAVEATMSLLAAPVRYA